MRHRQRHLHKTILEHVRTHLASVDWFDEAAPFGTVAVNLMDYEPQEAGETPPMNTVAVSIGDQGEDEPHELGGGLYRCEYVVFLDVYAASEPIGVAIADDIKDCLVDRIIPLRDYTTDAAGLVVDAQIEFEHVIVEHFPAATSTLDKRSWRSVKATACCYF